MYTKYSWGPEILLLLLLLNFFSLFFLGCLFPCFCLVRIGEIMAVTELVRAVYALLVIHAFHFVFTFPLFFFRVVFFRLDVSCDFLYIYIRKLKDKMFSLKATLGP